MKSRVQLEKSVPGHPPNAVRWAIPLLHTFTVNIYLRRRPNGPPFPNPFVIGGQPPRQRQYLTCEEFEERYGASQDEIDLVVDYVMRHGLLPIATSLTKRCVTVFGTVAAYQAAFGIQMQYFTYVGGTYQSYYSAIEVPADVAEVIIGIVGLDDRLIGAPPGLTLNRMPSWLQTLQTQIQTVAATQSSADYLFRLGGEFDWLAESLSLSAQSGRQTVLATLDSLQFKTPPGVANLYDFPADTDGSGQTIGIIELAGGYLQSDLETYFNFLGLPVPNIRNVSVLGAQNSPNVSLAYNVEIMIDISVSAGAAPGAQLVLYWAPITALGFVEAVQTAIHDPVNRPDVISASWDMSEAYWFMAPMTMDVFDSILEEAPLLGVTVCCSAADYGALSDFRNGQAWVDYPSSSPYVLSCGGTTLHSSGDQITAEVTWNTQLDLHLVTGGGVSQRFERPPWQDDVCVPVSQNPGCHRTGRGVPDVAGNANPLTGYLLILSGQPCFDAGTSAVAPLYAALVARINQSLGVRVGYINPFLYSRCQSAFRDIVEGNNIVYPPGPGYQAGPGWDACTGWGSPDGTKLRDALGVEDD